jgi:hypothetical protein
MKKKKALEKVFFLFFLALLNRKKKQRFDYISNSDRISKAKEMDPTQKLFESEISAVSHQLWMK